MSIIIVLGVMIIVFTKNIVHAAYALALALIGVAGLYVLLSAEFLAVVQIMLYAGGVVILLVFGVMMTNRLRGEKVISESRNQLLGTLISLVVFAGLLFLFSQFDGTLKVHGNQGDQVRQVGIAFLTEHIVAFELIAFILLVALVGATYLAKMAADE
ncbi:MAG: NADH-quinone oxidoreductase subunit J [Ekhidna sp.]|nr:NADH-quinone oxidoreductase subunit J [Ekhidna sp.]